MIKKLCILCLFPLCLSAQVIDNFSDGDFTNNPSWSGDEHQFEINSLMQLHLKSSGSDTSSLSTQNTSVLSTEWQFWIKQSFNSSDNNHSRIYIVSDSEDLEGPLNGYFVQVGSSDDNIVLFRQSNSIITEIIKGINTNTGNSVNQLRVKVIRDGTGNWKLFCDDTGGENYSQEGEGFDTIYKNSSYMGVFCKYTSSNASKFYFDDFYAGPVIVDTTPPELINIKAVTPNEISIRFSESLNSISAETPSNYFVDNGIGEPVVASINSSDPSIVNLTFSGNFLNGIINTIKIMNLKDLAGNILDEEYGLFSYYKVKAFDIVINEIMADPDPPRELPVTEYIELFNTTSFPIDLNNWKLEFSNSSKTFPDIIIEPQGFLIICKDNLLRFYGQLAEILTSSTSLSNDGTTVSLRNEMNNIISTISYSKSWYSDTYKEDGGWSMEQIDPYNPCGGKTNWRASVDMEGGTPGRRNSVYANNPDYDEPRLLRIGIINESAICLYFNEAVDSLSLLNTSNYSIDHGIGIVKQIIPLSPDFSSVVLHLNDTLLPGIIYHLSITDTIADCVGNILPLYSSIKFAFPSLPDYMDVVINEILFNPMDYIVRGNDFVEIYNRSDKVIDLKNFLLTSVNPITLIPGSSSITEESFLFFPEEYLVLTKKADIVRTQYYTSNHDGFIEIGSFPSYNNDEGIVEISLANGLLIDRFVYNEDMHFSLLNNTDGISLERVNHDRLTSELSNWHSASEASGFATPAYENSMFSSFESGIASLEISPEIFSPEDAYGNHFLNICYNMGSPGFLGNINIFDARGRLIRQLKRHELLGTKGCFTWDGTNEEGAKASIGIYIVLMEVFNLDGKVERFKKVCVLGGKL